MPVSDSDFEAKFTMGDDPTGVVEEPPFHMLMVGDWSGHAEKRDVSGRRPIVIDRDNFDGVIKKLGTRLDLQMPGGNVLPLEFAELDDFHPDRIFAQVPLFSELRDIRARLLDSDTFNSAAREMRSWFPAENPEEPKQAAVGEPKPPASSVNLLDQILSEPGGGSAPVRSPLAESGELNDLIGELVRPHLVRVDENEQSQVLAAVDQATGDLMRQILHNHEFQALEAAWRGLYFLVRRTETDVDLKIFILDISKDELADDLKSVSSLTDSVLYRLLVEEAIETPGGDPWSAVFGNYAFAPNPDDTATLIRISKIASAANAPFVSHIRPEILGVHSLAETPDPKRWDLSDGTDAGKLWTTLRGLPESEYLGMTIPRFLARLPYGTETEPLESFSFEEFTDKPVHDQYLWSNACFAVAQLLARSHSESGWEMGRSLIQDIDGLPVHIYKEDGESVFKPCAETLLTESACDRLMDYGLMPLVSYKNTDRVRLGRFQSIADPITALKGRWNP